MKELIIKVDGMVCEGCENRIKNSLSALDGVTDVKANHKTGIVNVTADEKITKEMLEETITDIGFEIIKEG